MDQWQQGVSHHIVAVRALWRCTAETVGRSPANYGLAAPFTKGGLLCEVGAQADTKAGGHLVIGHNGPVRRVQPPEPIVRDRGVTKFRKSPDVGPSFLKA